MIFSYNLLKSFFKKNFPKPKELAEILTMRAFECEEPQKVEEDFALNVDVLPNRPDCYSHFGLAREISAIIKKKAKVPKWRLKEEKKVKIESFIKINPQSINRTICKRYCARVIFDVKIEESPKWLKDYLTVCGFLSINNVVDVTNFVMLLLGQPLHAFDFEKIEGREIMVRWAKKGEKILTLDEEIYELDEKIAVISDKEKPIAIAGIKGGKESGISEKTEIVVLESANFEKSAILSSQKRLDLKTEASKRFEHGVSLGLAPFALDFAASLIQQIVNGKVAKGKIDILFEKKKKRVVRFDPQKISEILGVEISERQQLEILKSLGFRKIKDKFLEIPEFREDIVEVEDLAEEIGRIYGLERIKGVFPKTTLTFSEKDPQILWEREIKDIFKSMGFTEVINYSFLPERAIPLLQIPFEKVIRVKNPASFEFEFLRPTLLYRILENIKKNLPYFSEIKIFEIGKIFLKKEGKIIEKNSLGGAILGDKFFELKGYLDALLSKLGILDFWFDFYKPKSEILNSKVWNNIRCSEIKIGEDSIGILGEVSKEILEYFKIQNKVCVFEIDLEKLMEITKKEHEFKPYSFYPAIIRDVSIICPQKTLVDEIMQILENCGGENLVDVDLIDIYDIDEEKKSLTFRLSFQHKERAIEPKEVEELMKKMFKEIEKKPYFEIRK
jgi:phenylalanyl-tRNA synthetase beta chain